MLLLMNDPKRYGELSKKALERASVFSWKKSANEYLELYAKYV
jgi:glycosyltransferase involved in cell wall biosynthesis